jgi:trigger factor
MNITKENTSDLTAIIKLELKEEDYQDQVKSALKDYQRKANIPGFRQGKVPFGMINKMYGNAVLAEEINKKVSDSLNQYIVDEKLDILGYPLPNTEKTTTVDFDNQKEFEFFFDIGFTPKFELTLNDKIKVNYYNILANDEVVEKYLNDLRSRHGKTSNPETIEETDVLKGEFVELDENDNEVENGIQCQAAMALKTIKLKTELKKLVGEKVGDSVKFNPLKATKSAVDTATMLGITTEEAEKIETKFNFTITEISRTETAELNEEFFKLVYPQETIETEEQLREKIKKDAEVSFVAESDRQFMNNTVEELVKLANITLPDEFMKRWIVENGQGKMTAEQVEGQYENYSKSLKWQLIEAKLVKEHDIQVGEEDVKNQIKGYFSSMQENQDEETEKRMNEIVDSIMKNEEEVKRIYDQLYDTKLLEVFKSTIKQVKKKINYEEFVKLATQTN